MLRLIVGKKPVIFTLLILFVSFGPVVAGNDLTVVCPANKKECQLLENLVLFDERNIAPGHTSLPSTITVINRNPKEECLLAIKATNVSGSPILQNGVTVSIVDTNNVWYAGSITDLSMGDEKSLGYIPPKSQSIYRLTTSLNQNSGNEYQGLSTGFDLDLNFTCQLPTPSPTPTQLTTTQKTASENMVLGISIEGPACNERVPQPPILMTTIPGENSVTLVWLESNDPLTYYLVAYGTDPKRYDFGNPNVGGPGMTEYTVYDLSADTTYYFAIRAGNGCAPGEFSNQLPRTPSGKRIKTGQLADGFRTDILGTSNYDTSIPPAVYYQNQEKTLGENSDNYQPKLYMIPPVVLYLFSSMYRKNKTNRTDRKD